MTRIQKDIVELSQQAVSDFFEQRAQKFDAQHPLTSILYQDEHPEIAQQRDQLEKEKVVPLLGLSENYSVLDIGCGIGRWAKDVCGLVKFYYGVDASPSLIDLAKGFCPAPNVLFECYSADALTDEVLDQFAPFDRVILSGILIYLNDDQVSRMLGLISRHCRADAVIYIREPMGVSERLSLDQHWSQELNARYSAVYRTSADVTEIIRRHFPEGRYTIDPFSRLFEAATLNNRVETEQQFCFIRGIGA